MKKNHLKNFFLVLTSMSTSASLSLNKFKNLPKFKLYLTGSIFVIFKTKRTSEATV